MWLKIGILFVVLGSINLSTQNQCLPKPKSLEGMLTWKDLQTQCRNSIHDQIQMELRASIGYLAMSAHFTHAKSNRPGAAKFFLENAIEERAHAKKLIQYLLMRGGDISGTTIRSITQARTEWPTLESALTSALKMEHEVTKNIKGIIRVCGAEKPESAPTAEPKDQQDNDYHAVDYLTGDFLKEQHEGTRKIAGLLGTLKKMTDQYGGFAELMFDKSLDA